jgi:acyl-CoA reductase-like NAD-dependent aldehyde dehydrogenase
MVNLSLYPELKDVDPALVDDAVIGQIEAERAAIARTQQQVSLVADSYQEFEKENLDTIAFYASDIGILMKVRERFRGNQHICEFCEYFIRINKTDMEQISEEIENDRRTLKEITGI